MDQYISRKESGVNQGTEGLDKRGSEVKAKEEMTSGPTSLSALPILSCACGVEWPRLFLCKVKLFPAWS